MLYTINETRRTYGHKTDFKVEEDDLPENIS